MSWAKIGAMVGIARQEAKAETRVLAGRDHEYKEILGTSESTGSFLIFGQGNNASTPSSSMALYEKSTAASVPINMVADAFSIVNPVVMMNGKMLTEHPVLDLIRNPSPWFTQELFLEAFSKNFLVTGETAVVALGSLNAPPLELSVISPKSMTPVREGNTDFPARWSIAGNTLPGTYEGRPDGRRIRFFDGALRELMVARNFSTRDNSLLRGQSDLLPASREVRSHILGTEHNVSLLEKGGRVSLVFHFTEDMNEDDFEEVKNRVRSQFGGAGAAGEIAVTSGGTLDIKEAGISPKDMDFPNLQKMSIIATAMVYHVPLPLVTEARQTMNNFKEAKTALYDDAVIPLSRRIFGALGDFLFPRFGIDPSQASLAINPEDVPALVSRRMDEMIKRKQLGVESVNELRAQIAREPVEGGDIVTQPANLVPIGTDLFVEDNDPDNDDDDPAGVETDRD